MCWSSRRQERLPKQHWKQSNKRKSKWRRLSSNSKQNSNKQGRKVLSPLNMWLITSKWGCCLPTKNKSISLMCRLDVALSNLCFTIASSWWSWQLPPLVWWVKHSYPQLESSTDVEWQSLNYVFNHGVIWPVTWVMNMLSLKLTNQREFKKWF